MEHLQIDKKDMGAFQWWGTYLAWSEVGSEEDMERYYDISTERYIAKPDTWFVEGTECELVADGRPQMNIGIFRGKRISEGLPELHPAGEEYLDEENCSFDEFEVLVNG